jgi:hypothetical protein
MRDLELDLFLDLGRRVPNATGNQRKYHSLFFVRSCLGRSKSLIAAS